jgi:2,3-bisphosphoglycerate-dependent phosphoglycerate mutase/probable phosphoglycerate mutase
VTLSRLVLVRHGETEYNAVGRMQGQLDSELTDIGMDQIRAAAPVLAGYGPAYIVSSDLTRAARTAEEIGQVCGVPVKLDPRLRETHLGEWQGLTLPDVHAGWPGAWEVWRGDPTWPPPGGESRVDVVARAMPLIDELIEQFGDGPAATVMLFAHGGLIASLSCALMGLPTPNWTALAGPGNCRWTVLRRRVPQWRLAAHNVGREPAL